MSDGYAFQAGNAWAEPGETYEHDGISYALADWLDPSRWADEAALAAEATRLGLHPIAPAAPIAAGEREVGRELIDVAGVPTRHILTETIDLAELKATLIAKVNNEAGAFRRNFITDIPGQQATYLAKEEEAKAWTADLDQVHFPYLAHEAVETGVAVSVLVAQILATSGQWRALDPKIEGKRRGASVAIAAASTASAALAASTVIWGALLA